MANHQPLDNVTHKELRVVTSHHPKFGDTDSYARVTLSELQYAQSEYPLFMRKHGETGQFEIIAMFGLDAQENLFLTEQGWQAHYVPLSIQRRPFLIGYQQDENGQASPTVHVDMDSPRLSKVEGESVFMPQGGQTPYLQHINSVLLSLHEGLPQSQDFADKLQAYDLIEPVKLNIELNNGEKISLGSLYTIHEENLATLGADALAELHQKGYLQASYMMVASVHNLTKLIERKNQRG